MAITQARLHALLSAAETYARSLAILQDEAGKLYANDRIADKFAALYMMIVAFAPPNATRELLIRERTRYDLTVKRNQSLARQAARRRLARAAQQATGGDLAVPLTED